MITIICSIGIDRIALLLPCAHAALCLCQIYFKGTSTENLLSGGYLVEKVLEAAVELVLFVRGNSHVTGKFIAWQPKKSSKRGEQKSEALAVNCGCYMPF